MTRDEELKDNLNVEVYYNSNKHSAERDRSLAQPNKSMVFNATNEKDIIQKIMSELYNLDAEEICWELSVDTFEEASLDNLYEYLNSRDPSGGDLIVLSITVDDNKVYEAKDIDDWRDYDDESLREGLLPKAEEKGYLFYIYKVKVGYNYKPVDPKYYSEEGLKKFASEYAKDGILYKTEKECQDIIKELNRELKATFDFTGTIGTMEDGYVTIEDGYVVVTFPSGKEIKLLVDPVYETINIKTRE